MECVAVPAMEITLSFLLLHEQRHAEVIQGWPLCAKKDMGVLQILGYRRLLSSLCKHFGQAGFSCTLCSLPGSNTEEEKKKKNYALKEP